VRRFIVVDDKGAIDKKNAVDGNFYQTDYSILVYYHCENTGRYDRVVGKGNANSLNIIN
jgi:hypothetical protein